MLQTQAPVESGQTRRVGKEAPSTPDRSIEERRARFETATIAFVQTPLGATPACGIIRAIVAEMAAMAGGERPVMLSTLRGPAARRSLVHQRQITMYVAHVVLSLSMTEIGQVFGRDRTTVAHACHVVEDRRDDAAYDAFIAAVERLVIAVFRGGSLRNDH
jgi:chromosomal replication initiation ATPase DnaA